MASTDISIDLPESPPRVILGLRLNARVLPLLVALVVALLHGLLYVWLVPPWQHYDEPTHFEYAWLVANRPGLPQPGDYDAEMRLAVARSMAARGFFNGLGAPPALENTSEPAWIGQYAQLNDPPLYYFLASLPLRFFAGNPTAHIEAQLYAARLVSLALMLVVVTCAYGIALELTSPANPVRWLLPLSVAMVPAFIDIMTAVNNDAGAVALFSIFLWAAVRLIRRGPSWGGVLLLLGTAVVSYWVKNTVWVSLPLAMVVVALAVLRGRWRWLVWVGFAAAAAAAFFLFIRWGDAALWFRSTLQKEQTRAVVSAAPVGEHAFQLVYAPGQTNVNEFRLLQILPTEETISLNETPITVGAWIWSDRPVEVLAPQVFYYSSRTASSQAVQISETPAFYSFVITPTVDTGRIGLVLGPLWQAQEQPLTVYYDGVVLAEGARPADEAPHFSDARGTGGTWGGRPFTNLVRNGSAESAWPQIDSRLEQVGMKVMPDRGRLSVTLYTWLDSEVAGPYYYSTASTLFRTFWAKFGWGQVSLLGPKPYRLILGVTLVSALGLPLLLWRSRRSLPWHLLLWLGLATLVIWAFAFFRGSVYFFIRPYYPIARYAYPAIIPVMLLWSAGWRGWALGKREKIVLVGVVLFLAVLDIFALASLVSFYY